MTPVTDLWTIAGAREELEGRGGKAQFESEFTTFLLKVKETDELQPEKSSRAGNRVVCYEHVEPM
jgi:hypothetical protein